MSEATNFINAFFSGMRDGQNILIWTLPSRTSYWGGSLGAASAIAEAQVSKHQDTYFGVGTRRFGKHITSDERGKDSDVSYLYGMWLDIDMRNEAHAKENLPATDEEALSILEAVPLEPTILVHSGHGYQAHWLFDEPLAIGLGTEAAKRMTMRWNYTFKRFAQRCGWDVDSVFDLARVMRLPGGRNVKHGGDVPVEMIRCEPERRYSIDELMEHCVDDDVLPDVNGTNLRAGNVVMNYSATYPVDKFEALSENNPDFLARWKHTKPPSGGDQSMSAYDMSLASMAAYAGWSLQEIVDLLICHRRTRKELDPNNKEQRFDYIERTARKAWTDAQDAGKREAAKAALIVTTSESQAEDGDIPGDGTPWEAVSKALLIDIRGMTKYLSDEPTYKIQIGDKHYDLGTIENITSWARFQNKIATHTGKAIPKSTSKNWSDYWSRMLMSASVVSIADGGSADMLYEDRFNQWLESQSIVRVNTEVEMGDTGTVFQLRETLYFSLDDFYRWLKLFHHDSAPRGAVAKVLRGMGHGAMPHHITVVRDGKRTTRNMWCYVL